MTWDPTVLSELVLAGCAVVGCLLAARGPRSARPFWWVGIGAIGLAALAGAFRYGRVLPTGPHEALVEVASTVGVSALLAGAIASYVRGVGPLVYSVLLAGVIAGRTAGPGVPEQELSMGAIVLMALIGWKDAWQASVAGILGVAAIAATTLQASAWAGPLELQPMDVRHYGMAAGVVLFGLAAMLSVEQV